MEFKNYEIDETDKEFDIFYEEDFEDTMDLTEIIEQTKEINLEEIQEKLMSGEQNES